MSIQSCPALTDTILFDYLVNYVFPQYALPWNNFYTNIDAEPYYTRNDQRNQNARIAKSPLSYNPQANLVLQTGTLPNWVASLSQSTGSVIDTNATKSLLGKIFTTNCVGLDYQYIQNTKFVNVNSQSANNWIIIQFNLVNQTRSNLSVVTVSSGSSVYSSLSGTISINNTTISLFNPIPYGPNSTTDPSPAIIAGTSNTLYGLYGNRIFIAVYSTSAVPSQATITSNIQFRIAETPTLAQAIGAPLLG
jgi:hypothetical protein